MVGVKDLHGQCVEHNDGAYMANIEAVPQAEQLTCTGLNQLDMIAFWHLFDQQQSRAFHTRHQVIVAAPFVLKRKLLGWLPRGLLKAAGVDWRVSPLCGFLPSAGSVVPSATHCEYMPACWLVEGR